MTRNQEMTRSSHPPNPRYGLCLYNDLGTCWRDGMTPRPAGTVREAIPLDLPPLRLLVRRTRCMAALWLGFGIVVGSGSVGGGWIGILSGAIAGALVLPWLGVLLGLLG